MAVRSYHVRRALVASIVVSSTVLIVGIWRDVIAIYDGRGHTESHIDAAIGGLVQTTSGVAAIALALIFVTAQLSASKSSVLRELYRGGDVYLLLAYVVATIIAGYGVLVAFPGGDLSSAAQHLTDTVLVFAVTTVLLITPVLMLQLENLDVVTLAAKFSDSIKPRAVIAYGLTDVQSPPRSGEITYGLNTVGLRPKSVDPFRPIHEILMTAVDARDRVLLGKLLRQLLRPILRVYGAAWDDEGLLDATTVRPNFYHRLRAMRFTSVERVHTTLAILHYVVKRARNLRAEWDGRDIGRHGTITALGDLVVALGAVRDSDIAIRLALYAARQTAEYYADVKPFGRIEPFADYFRAANSLLMRRRAHEAELCVEVLAWVAINTRQLEGPRLLSPRAILCPPLADHFDTCVAKAKGDSTWLPGRQAEDPWIGWLQ